MSFNTSEFFIGWRSQIHTTGCANKIIYSFYWKAELLGHLLLHQVQWPWNTSLVLLGPRAPSQQRLQLHHSNLPSLHLLTHMATHTHTHFAPQLLQMQQLWPQFEDFSLLAWYFPLNIHKLFVPRQNRNHRILVNCQTINICTPRIWNTHCS